MANQARIRTFINDINQYIPSSSCNSCRSYKSDISDKICGMKYDASENPLVVLHSDIESAKNHCKCGNRGWNVMSHSNVFGSYFDISLNRPILEAQKNKRIILQNKWNIK